MTNFQSAQRKIERHTLEYRILQLLIRYQIKRDDADNVVYINTGIKFTTPAIAEMLRVKKEDTYTVSAALLVLMSHKPEGLVYPEGSQWFVTHGGIEYFGDSVRSAWHDTRQTLAKFRNEALTGAKEVPVVIISKSGESVHAMRTVQSDLKWAALPCPNPPSSQDADGDIVQLVDSVASLRVASAQLKATPEETRDAMADGTARKCSLCGIWKWIQDFYRTGSGSGHRTICKECMRAR